MEQGPWPNPDRRSRPTRRELLSRGGSLTAGIACGLAGCLEGRPGRGDPHLGEPAPFVGIDLSDDAGPAHVQPPVAHLVDDGTVEWTAVDGTHVVASVHPATHGTQARIPEEAEPWTSGPIADGESFDRAFEVEGVFDYVCTRHERQGAVGSIVVGWPDPDGEPALEPPDEGYSDVAIDAIERRNDRVRAVLEEVHE